MMILLQIGHHPFSFLLPKPSNKEGASLPTSGFSTSSLCYSSIMPPNTPSHASSSSSSFAQSLTLDPLGDFVVPSNAIVLSAPSLQNLQEAIESTKEQLSTHQSSSQYLLVTDINQALFDYLEGNGEVIKGVTATIAHNQGQILYKVTAGAQHSRIIGMFAAIVPIRLFRMGLDPEQGHWETRGSAMTRGNICSKEADWSMGPSDPSLTYVPLVFRPSLVLEVGLAESLPQLRHDAQWWYANSGATHETKLVVLISVQSTPSYRVDIEVWAEIQAPCCDSQSPFILNQKVWFENDAVHRAPLILPFKLLMGREPTGSESDILLDDQAIRRICTEIRG